MFSTARKWFSVAVIAVGIAACDESPISLAEPTSVAASTAEMRLTVGDAATLSNQVLDQDGRPIRGLQASFRSDNPSVVSVDANGNVRAVSPGTATIVTSYGSMTAATKVTVVRDERGFVRTLDILADSVVTDVRAGVQPIFLRAFNGFGQSVCPQTSIQVADRTVVNVTQTGCRLNVEPTFPGRTTVTVSADGISDTFTVAVSSTGAVSFVSARPTPAQTFAGNTVPYSVRVLDEAGNPVANRVVNFDVTAGRLSASSVTTDASGAATVQYTLPTDLRTFGSTQALTFRAQLPSGGTVSGGEIVGISAAAPASIRLYRLSNYPYYYDTTATEITGSSISARVFQNVFVGASAEDQYGNAVQNFNFSVTAPATRTCGNERIYNKPATEGTCLFSTTAGTATFTASTGGVSRSVQVEYTP